MNFSGETAQKAVLKTLGLFLTTGILLAVLSACSLFGNGNSYGTYQEEPYDQEFNVGQDDGADESDPGDQADQDDPTDPEDQTETPDPKDDPEPYAPPTDPQPDIPPIDPEPEDPQPTDPIIDQEPDDGSLDFSELESKLESIAASVQRGATLNDLISYSVKDGDLYFVADIKRAGNDRVIVYKEDGNYDFSTQQEINDAANSLTKSDFTQVFYIQKSSSDIVVDGVTYSKSGIYGDNIFARQCGVNNATLTYVGTPGSNNFDSRFDTGYSKQVQILTLSNEGKKLVAKKTIFDTENFSGYTNDQVYTNLVTEGKSIKHSEQEINLGENLKR